MQVAEHLQHPPRKAKQNTPQENPTYKIPRIQVHTSVPPLSLTSNLTNVPRTPIRKAPPPPPPPKPNPFKNRIIPIFFGSITLLVLSGYSTYLYVYLTREPSLPVPSKPEAQPDVSSRYDKIAATFDSAVDFNESLMRLPALRRKLVEQAKGDVLEVSIGTGRNLEYYDWDFKGVGKMAKRPGARRGKVRSFTAIDKSAEMLEVAHEKFTAMFPGTLGVRWVVGDAEQDIPPPPKDANERSGNLVGQKYDTVVQTMGLCSVGDPVGLLRKMGSVVKEEDGRILLLEHGRGNWAWLNGVLDRFSEAHAREFGCWWNRDLGAIVRESGLEVVEMKSIWWHGGTTWWIELKKPRGFVAEKTKEEPHSPEAVKGPLKEETKKK